jgi:hypothetical protein
MEDPIEELRKKILENFTSRKSDWVEKTYSSQQYQQELKYIKDISTDYIDTLRAISIYSTRGVEIYNKFLCIRAIDDLIQSAIAILTLVENGIHNTVKRELRYLIEMITKYVIVDYAKMGESFEVKTEYLRNEIPNSSIDIVNQYSTPFSVDTKEQFQSEIKDFFYKACAYVHPSKKQIDEQVKNYERGNTIGFESSKMFIDINKLVFRAYDMILTMVFHSYGYSMSKDLFEQIFNDNPKWKFHKGKYVKEYSKTLFI